MAIAAVNRASARAGFADALAVLSGALLLLVTLAFAVLMVVEVLARFRIGRPIFDSHVEILETYFGLGFAAVSVLALPAALAAPFVRRGTPPMRSRSALALVPGCWLGLLGVVAGIALYIGGGLDAGTALSLGVRNLVATFANHVFPFAPLIIVLSAAIGGAQSPEATVAVAAPAATIWLVGVSAEISITANIATLLLPLLALAAAFAILFAAAPARAITPWLVGAVLPIGMILPLAAGLTTPTEVAAFFAAFGLLVALLVRVAGLRQPLGPMLRQAAIEMAAIVAVLAAARLLTHALALSGALSTIVEAIGTGPTVFIVGGFAFFALSYLLTPAFTVAVGASVAIPVALKANLDTASIGPILVLIGLAAVIARAGRRVAAPSASLPLSAAWIAAAIALAIAIMVALLPEIALFPVRALR